MRMILAVAFAASLPLAAQTRAQGWTNGELMIYHSDISPVSSSFTIEPFAYEFTGGEQYDFAIASPLSLASISARIDHGWARVVAAASGAVEGAPANQRRQGSAGYSVSAGFLDSITIDAPGLTGQTGTVRIGMDVEGVVSAGADWWPGQSVAVSGGAATIRFFGPGISARRVAEVRNPAEPPDFFPGETIEGFLGGTAEIVFGTPFPIEFSVFLSGNADAISNDQPGVTGAQAAASMVGDFGNTFAWAGISELRDAGGEPVLDFTVTSLSSTDYRNPIVPVPEAGTSLPALAGLAVLAGRRRRTRSLARGRSIPLAAAVLAVLSHAAPAGARPTSSPRTPTPSSIPGRSSTKSSSGGTCPSSSASPSRSGSSSRWRAGRMPRSPSPATPRSRPSSAISATPPPGRASSTCATPTECR